MKNPRLLFGIFLVAAFLISISSTSMAQNVRPSLKASVSQTIGIDTEITIVYSRPGVKGRKIWGDIVPFGLAPGNSYSKDKPFPWRGGANENTTIEFSKDVLVNGSKLKAGKYGLHMIPSESDWIVIFNKRNADWGSYSYDENEDALRIKVKPVAAPHQEWLVYGFETLAGTSTTVFLYWEKLKVPFGVGVVEVE